MTNTTGDFVSRISLLLAAMLLSEPLLAANPTAHADDRTPARLERFEDGVPAGFSTLKGQLSVSGEHVKDGSHSLKWDWREGDSLVIRHPFAFRPFVANGADQRRDGITVWIYSSRPFEGQYRFQFHKGEQAASSFVMNANFTGWRAAVVSFEMDMEGQPLVGMDRLTITPPVGAASGTAWIDQLGLDMRIDMRHPAADYQLPYLNKTALSSANRHWTALIHFDRWLQEAQARRVAVAAPEPVATEPISALIDGELLEGKLGSGDALEIARRQVLMPNGAIKALAETAHQWEMYTTSGVDKNSMAALRASTATWKEFGAAMRVLAVAYRRGKDGATRDKLRDLFLQLNSNLADQGLVRGSGQGLMHHQGYILRDWADAVFLMRDELGEQRAQTMQALAYYAGLGRVYEPTSEIVEFNVDVMNTMIQPALYAILMDTDAARRDALLGDLSAWMSASTLKSQGLAGGIKPDGSVFHHGQHYVAYGNGGLTGVTAVVRYLEASRFPITEQAYARIRDAVLRTRVYSSDGLIPMSLTGRHPDGFQSIAIAPFRSLAQARGAADPELASAYLRLVRDDWAGKKASGPTEVDQKLARELAAKGVKPEADPQGSWTMNYSSMALHRRDGWLAAARGYSRYLAGNESYYKKNLYGRTINYGALEIMPADGAKRGFAADGWNWNRWPGTTAIQQPLARLEAKVLNVEPSAGVEEMLLSEESYSGGLDFRGWQGMFAMKLQGHPKYGDDLVARKSVFMFDGRIVALGSGISASDRQSPVQTTLFQDRLLPGEESAGMDGVGAPWSANETRLRLDGSRFARDERGNGWCLAPGQTVAFKRGTQASVDETGSTATRGDFASLVIDHGVAPANAGYEYATFVGMPGDTGRKMCSELGTAKAAYAVIARSRRAHIVHDRATGLIAYALFEPGAVESGGLLQAVSSPAMLMLRGEKDKLSGSFVNPDLNLYQGRDPEQYDASGARRERIVYGLSWMEQPSRPIDTVVTLRGRWKLASPVDGLAIRVNGRTSELMFRTRHATPVQFDLVRD
ncbi:chondroitinase family polysaccharide lyase [Roseateles sp.]|uniref:chondroitinase family polysaccharide lyase n=1 Tax=Roseateles sp. TaxID=1971397 RepID=UPI0026008AEB|nr:chondroitinase family polysaccharide lyase [Roseateles sp.]MBV8035141.1 hypothetical protein [Roseateles sp.]